MAAILLLLLVILAGESLQQGGMEEFEISGDACANETAAILQELTRLQQPEFRCEGREESLGQSLEALKNSMDEQFASINASIVEMKNDHEKVNADVKSFKEQTDANFRDLRSWFELHFSSLKEEVAKNSFCGHFKARLGGLQVKKLSTGVYFYQQESMRHSLASAWCKERGMRLAQFETLQEMKIVAENAPNDYIYWVAASDVGFAAGDFRWGDGSKVEREFWLGGEPDHHGAGKEACVFTRQFLKKLVDYPCTYSFRPLCEVPREFSGCL